MPTYSCGERLKRGGVEAFLYSLPGILLAALGWIAYLVGFGWLNDQTSLYDIDEFRPSVSRGILAEHYLVAIAPAIYFVLFSIYLLTGLWAVGILSQLAATLVLVVAGGMAYISGRTVALQFETERPILATETPTLTEPEIYRTVLFAGSVQLSIGMIYCMAVLPVIATFHHKNIFDDPYATPSNNRSKFRAHFKSTLCSLPATLLTAVGYIAFVVGFGWLNQQDSNFLSIFQTFDSNFPHTVRWELAGYYILAISPPIYFVLYSIYMVIGKWPLGIVSQLGATVVTAAAGGMAYGIGLNITLLFSNGATLSTDETLRQHQIYYIVAFAGALVVCIGMAYSNALVPVMSSIDHNKPLQITSQNARQGQEKHEMTSYRY